MDRAIDPTAATQPAVGGVDDGIDIEGGDVGDEDLEVGSYGQGRPQSKRRV